MASTSKNSRENTASDLDMGFAVVNDDGVLDAPAGRRRKMTDPYQILGVSPTASDDEIKKVYRTLSRKYHPDANVNNPNKDLAEEKFKEVQQAYDQIMKDRQDGIFGYDSNTYSGSSTHTNNTRNTESNTDYGQGPFGGFAGQYYYGNTNNARHSTGPDSQKLQAAANYLNNRCYKEAVNVLNEIPFPERNGRWYYFSAMANEALGNLATAMEHIHCAVVLDPGNVQYRKYEQHLEFGSGWYNDMGSSYERPYANAGNFCMSMLLMEALCWCCCPH